MAASCAVKPRCRNCWARLRGRYAVTVAQGTLKHAFDNSLDEVLTRGALELGSQLDALSFPLLNRVARVVFDEDAYPALVNQSPAVMREVVERLHSGESPVKLGQRGDIAQATLEAILLDMGRRGAIRGVVGSAGEDLFAEARAARGREQPWAQLSPQRVSPQGSRAPRARVRARDPKLGSERHCAGNGSARNSGGPLRQRPNLPRPSPCGSTAAPSPDQTCAGVRASSSVTRVSSEASATCWREHRRRAPFLPPRAA